MNIVKVIKARINSFSLFVREKLSPAKIADAGGIPVIINNFNRLESLKLLIESLEKRGYTNIHILDNASSYPPLLDYYKSCRYEVVRLGRNLGFKALWKDKAVRKRFCRDYYIYTDSDVVLSDDCPADVVGRIFNLLRYKYKFAVKIGLYLRIDDLPDCFAGKEDVVAWEKRYHKPANGDGLYRSPTDTTFAIYRPHAGLNRSRYAEAYRTVPPYSVRHLPWYQDSACLSEEEKYYAEHCSQSTHWTSKTIN